MSHYKCVKQHKWLTMSIFLTSLDVTTEATTSRARPKG